MTQHYRQPLKYTSEGIKRIAREVASHHNLDKDRVVALYHIFEELDNTQNPQFVGTRNFPENSPLKEAIKYLKAEEALELFEKNDPRKIMLWDNSVKHFHPGELINPFTDYSDFEDRIETEIQFIEDNEKVLIDEGFPKRIHYQYKNFESDNKLNIRFLYPFDKPHLIRFNQKNDYFELHYHEPYQDNKLTKFFGFKASDKLNDLRKIILDLRKQIFKSIVSNKYHEIDFYLQLISKQLNPDVFEWIRKIEDMTDITHLPLLVFTIEKDTTQIKLKLDSENMGGLLNLLGALFVIQWRMNFIHSEQFNLKEILKYQNLFTRTQTGKYELVFKSYYQIIKEKKVDVFEKMFESFGKLRKAEFDQVDCFKNQFENHNIKFKNFLLGTVKQNYNGTIYQFLLERVSDYKDSYFPSFEEFFRYLAKRWLINDKKITPIQLSRNFYKNKLKEFYLKRSITL